MAVIGDCGRLDRVIHHGISNAYLGFKPSEVFTI